MEEGCSEGVGVVDWESRAEEKMEESSAGRVDYQWGFCKDEKRTRVGFYGIRWSALILSPHVRSHHDPLNSRAPCKNTPRQRARGGG